MSLFVLFFSAMKETWDEAEFVLQPPLSKREIQCAEEVARGLDLLVEKVSHLFANCRILLPPLIGVHCDGRTYLMAGNFRGVLIFVVDSAVTKISPYKN